MVTGILNSLRLEAGTVRRLIIMKLHKSSVRLKRRALPASKRNHRSQNHVPRSFAATSVLFALALLVAGTLGVSSSTRAQRASASAPATQAVNRIELHQALLDLTNPWTVMCIAAHPDDEDGTSLIVMRRKYGAHTVSLFSTFGEGGQNAIGPELYEELGAIRARETKTAAEIQGSEPYFLGLRDFGFSKSADEAFRIWDHDEALRRMVLRIRKLQPDVIITNHSATNNDHGHHQATARLELEAFDAAADPKRFPEQLKDDATVWQVQRLFVRVRGNQPADAGGIITIDPNERDPISNTTFAEQALSALQKHATQGPWPRSVAQMAARFTNSTDGRLPLIRYRLALAAKSAPALPKDPQNFLDGLRLREETRKLIELPTIDGRALTEFSDNAPRVLEQLVRGLRAGLYGFNEDKIDEPRLSWMRDRLMRALALAAGVRIQVAPSTPVITPGSTLDLAVNIANGGNTDVTVSGCGSGISLPVEPANSNKTTSAGTKGGFLDRVKLPAGSALERTVKIAIPGNASVNVPLSNHLYEPSLQDLHFRTSCMIDLPDGYFYLNAATPVEVAPGLELTNVSPSPIIRTPADVTQSMNGTEKRDYRDFNFKVRVTNNQDSPFSGELVVDQGFGRNGLSRRITVPAHDKADITLKVPGYPQSTGLRKAEGRQPGPVTFTVATKGAATPLAQLEVPVVWADARVAPGLRVGYVRGFDFSLPNALDALGVESKELSVDEIQTADLHKYTTIIVDNRVYESVPELIAANQRLLDYTKDGGTLIVFYHKSNEWNPDERRKRPQLAPYKLILGDERVTDETAPVTFLEPEHPLLNRPNNIGQGDFANWIQERGLYYPKEWDPQYHALLQTNDPDEPPLKGGLLVAQYGKGNYIYTSMVWYRELRAGVPGAYRMFANMISYK